jgi:Trypsin-like peptidase domain
MKPLRKGIWGLLAILALGCAAVAGGPAQSKGDDSNLSFAICPIVYPLDQSPSDRGFHYLFYGNGFFINDKGYLLTAAHVLSQLSDASPYVVLRLPMAPPRMLKAAVMAIDRDHDVALLRVTPNPFEGKYQVRFLSLAVQRPTVSQDVLAAALRPSRLKDPHTFDAFSEDRPAGRVLAYEFSQLDKGRPDTELLLFGHEVLLGDSGAPVVSTGSQAVVGLIEGRWLRANAASLATVSTPTAGGVGAAVPVHYAISLLQQHGVAWHAAEERTNDVAQASASLPESDGPVPLSLVAAPLPSQALQGGHVVLDALVNREGQLDDISVVHGAPPFLDQVLSAVHTWSFVSPRASAEGTQARLGIVFQFAPPGFSQGKSTELQSAVPSESGADRAALPILITETESLASSNADAGVILSARIDARGRLGTMDVLRDPESLAHSVIAAVRRWQFAAATCRRSSCDSTVIIVVIPRPEGAVSFPTQTNGQAHNTCQKTPK